MSDFAQRNSDIFHPPAPSFFHCVQKKFVINEQNVKLGSVSLLSDHTHYFTFKYKNLSFEHKKWRHTQNKKRKNGP